MFLLKTPFWSFLKYFFSSYVVGKTGQPVYFLFLLFMKKILALIGMVFLVGTTFAYPRNLQRVEQRLEVAQQRAEQRLDRIQQRLETIQTIQANRACVPYRFCR
jgi:hypothetical protein